MGYCRGDSLSRDHYVMTPKELTALADAADSMQRLNCYEPDGLGVDCSEQLTGFAQALRQYAKVLPYVQHQSGCAIELRGRETDYKYPNGVPPCTCGLDEVRSDDT